METLTLCILYCFMKQLLLYLINPCIPLTIYIVGCNSNNSAQQEFSKNTAVATTNTAATTNTTSTYKDYNTIKAVIATERQQLIHYYKNVESPDYDKAVKKYLSLFENKLVPSWLGTKWDFNGITRTPKKGAIACGYFVTTTLYDMGVAIDIAKYAQCGSDIMVKHLIENKSYRNLSNLRFTDFINTLKSKAPFLAIVGLDFHTGYLLNNGKELYFIHSSYKNRRGVVKEIAATAAELQSSKWKSIGYITNDKKFMQNWLNSSHPAN
jgi:hypothetical protein